MGDPLTAEQTVSILDDLAKQKGDSFRLRVMRRGREHQVPQFFLAFDDAQVCHFAAPETWLPEIAASGGGIFEIMAYHMSNPVMPIGGTIKIPVEGDTRPPDISVIQNPGWQGPKKLTFPKVQRTETIGTAGSLPSPDQGLQPVRVGSSPSPQHQGQPQPGAMPQTPASAALASDPGLFARVTQAEEALRRRERELDEREARAREERMRTELREEMRREMGALRPAHVAPSPVEGIVAALTPILPQVLGVIQQGRAEAQAREERLLALLTTPRGPDPAVAAMAARLDALLAAKDNGNGPMVSQMAEAMGTMTSSMMQVVHTAAEMASMQGPAPSEPTWIKALREGAKAVLGMMQVQAAMANQRRLPAAVAVPAAPPPPAVQPGVLPPGQPAAPAEANGAPPDVIGRIEAAIRKGVPVDRVAEAFFQALSNDALRPQIDAALAPHNGDYEGLLKARLGLPWLMQPANLAYVNALKIAFEQKAEEMGFVREEEGGEDDGDEGEEEETTQPTAAAPPPPPPPPPAQPAVAPVVPLRAARVGRPRMRSAVPPPPPPPPEAAPEVVEPPPEPS
jgi:hypothetical protein